MPFYEINTPGARFLFITDPPSANSIFSPPPYTVFINNYTEYDYELIASDFKEVYMPDLIYAFSIYMSGIRGLPSGEYEIKIQNKIAHIFLPHSREDIVVKIEKCKLLYSNMHYYEYNSEILLSSVETERCVYVAVVCDDANNFDTVKIAPRMQMKADKLGMPGALLVISGTGQEYIMHSFDFKTKAPVFSSDSVAAAYTVLFPLDEGKSAFFTYNGTRSSVIRTGGIISIAVS